VEVTHLKLGCDMDLLIIILIIIKDTILVVSAAAVAYVACLGLTTWKKELRAKSNHEIARKVLKAVFRVRGAVHHVRNNWISVDEYPQKVDMTFVDKEIHMFKLRWELLDTALQEFNEAKVEAQALWGKEFETILEPVYKVITKLNYLINEYLEKLSNLPPKQQENIVDKSILELKADIFHVPMLDSRRGTFGDELFHAFKHVEDNVRPKLYRARDNIEAKQKIES
jgi:hypothetical protein